MTTPTPDISDVVVIGAGIVGAAIARDLAGTGQSVTLVDARDDVGDGTPGTTPPPAPWNPGSSPAAMTFSGITPSRPAFPSSGPARCSSPGPMRKSTPCLT